MKRMLFVLVLVCLATAGFASDVSVGLAVSGSYNMQDTQAPGGSILITSIPFAFSAYVDSKYIEAAIGYRVADGFHITSKPDGGPTTESDDNSKYSYVTFAAYGKFPIPVGSFSLVPMVGVEYDLTVSAEDDNGNSANSSQRADLNSLWIKAGLGIEIPVSSTMYIRPDLLLGYQLNNQSEKDTIDFFGLDSITDLNFELAVQFGVKL